ncbi:aminoglycoside phosphotransferase family protein [Acrocarpospora catenulata]|uniref:aminoglycoside phosphotransferase family protein n=1 Tax=Acrocarpospora catenulata TaxID=2836182 RepID=UPI001BD958B9|nr:aminoglycoside phosphotransferase family protein [Acrocarpospora catenulata]
MTAVITANDEVLGEVGPFTTDSPWWADVEDIATHLSQLLKTDVIILRLLTVEDGAFSRGGHATYHAEILKPTPNWLIPPTHPRDGNREADAERVGGGNAAANGAAEGGHEVQCGEILEGTPDRLIPPTRPGNGDRDPAVEGAGRSGAVGEGCSHGGHEVPHAKFFEAETAGRSGAVGEGCSHGGHEVPHAKFFEAETAGRSGAVGEGSSHGGHKFPHAKFFEDVPRLRPLTNPFDREPHPKRSSWATATGVRAALSWAEEVLGESIAKVEQVKTWNLSGLFRVWVGSGVEPVWLKATPGFAACESTAIEVFGSVDSSLVPEVVGADRGNRRILMRHIPGEDCWQAPEEVIEKTLPRMVRAQAVLAGRGRMGALDRTDLSQSVRTLLAGEVAMELTEEELREAKVLAERVPAMTAELVACGVPYTMVHGDFHPGNWRWDGTKAVLVDFADWHYGHPAMDVLRLREFLPERRDHITDIWVHAWRVAVPSSDPAKAVALAEPLSRLYYAVRYQEFLDGIEPSERRYHAGDPAAEIRAALGR